MYTKTFKSGLDENKCIVFKENFGKISISVKIEEENNLFDIEKCIFVNKSDTKNNWPSSEVTDKIKVDSWNEAVKTAMDMLNK